MNDIFFARLNKLLCLIIAGSLALVSGTAISSMANATDAQPGIVAEHLDRPQAVAPISAGTAFVALQSGEVLRIKDGVKTILDA